jgi:hypothetical protein
MVIAHAVMSTPTTQSKVSTSTITPRMAAAMQREKRIREANVLQYRKENVMLRRKVWRLEKRFIRHKVGT